MVRVRGHNRGRGNIAGVVCHRAGRRCRCFFKLHVWHGRRGEAKAFTWRQYRDLIVMTRIQLGTPVVWCWDNLTLHLVRELAAFTEEHKDWLQIFQMPSCAPELIPAEGIWSLLKRHLADFAATDLTHLTRVIMLTVTRIPPALTPAPMAPMAVPTVPLLLATGQG